MTLITCQNYNQARNEYDYRVAVRAVLVSTEADDSPGSVNPSGDHPGAKNR
jgi:hypothetical protein